MNHPLISEYLRLHGVAHPSNGRRLPTPLSFAGVLSRSEQEARISDTAMWTPHQQHAPVADAVAGARAYASKMGLPDPHAVDYSKIMTSADNVRQLGRSYDKLPDFDAKATPHFDAMRNEIGQQFHHLTNTMGIKAHFVDHDPYKSAAEMIGDVRDHKRIKVLRTAVTGSHPYFSDEDNDRFRAVHDFFGHAATGREFDAHGEDAAALAHSKMFSRHALPAMASETRGQNGSLNLNGEFAPQKIAVMPRHLWTPTQRSDFGRGASKQPRRVMNVPLPFEAFLRKQAHDSGDGQTIYHCPFCGSGQVIARSDRTIECEFCHTAFTVQVQPQYSAFPQTIDGQPVQVPGMPAGGGAAPMPEEVDPTADPNEQPPVDPNAPQDEEEGDEEDPKPNPFTSRLRSSTGVQLSMDDYLAHLALQHTDSRSSTMELVRKQRRR